MPTRKAGHSFVDEVPTTEKGRDGVVQAWGLLFRKLGEVAELKDSNRLPYLFHLAPPSGTRSFYGA